MKKCPKCGLTSADSKGRCWCGQTFDPDAVVTRKPTVPTEASGSFDLLDIFRSKPLICGNCGYEGTPKKVVPGSILIELVLWIALIIPGLIYSIWRLTNIRRVCPKCQAPNMIPLDAPRGQKLHAEYFGASRG